MPGTFSRTDKGIAVKGTDMQALLEVIAKTDLQNVKAMAAFGKEIDVDHPGFVYMGFVSNMLEAGMSFKDVYKQVEHHKDLMMFTFNYTRQEAA